MENAVCMGHASTVRAASAANPLQCRNVEAVYLEQSLIDERAKNKRPHILRPSVSDTYYSVSLRQQGSYITYDFIQSMV